MHIFGRNTFLKPVVMQKNRRSPKSDFLKVETKYIFVHLKILTMTDTNYLHLNFLIDLRHLQKNYNNFVVGDFTLMCSNHILIWNLNNIFFCRLIF